MLTYFGFGDRDYASCPIGAGRPRPTWEFQAVLDGEIARMEPKASGTSAFRRRTLWLSRPASNHGWTGRPGEKAKVAVFHFRHVPKVLEQALGPRSHHAIALDEVEASRIDLLARRIDRHWRRPSPGMLLAAEAVVSELSLLVYEDIAAETEEPSANGTRQVGRALEIYSERMADNPSLSEIAAELGVSVAHLRRWFHAHLGDSPKEVFTRLREQRILELLTDTDCGLETIAEQTGFSESSALSRAFKTRFGCSPSRVRTGQRR